MKKAAIQMNIVKLVSKQQAILGREKVEANRIYSVLLGKDIREVKQLGFAFTGLRVKSIKQYAKNSLFITASSLINNKLTESRLKEGDEVEIQFIEKKVSLQRYSVKEMKVFGAIKSIMQHTILVVSQDENAGRINREDEFSIRLATRNDIYARMYMALDKLENYKRNRPHLHFMLFDDKMPTFNEDEAIDDKKFFDQQLNEQQRQAVKHALMSRDLSLIHGPPGTGKTSTIIEIIRQLASRGQKLLVCGPSNVSVDNIAERLSNSSDVRFLREGNPARVKESVLKTCLASEIQANREIGDVNVVLSTLCGSSRFASDYYNINFDVVIIDEAAQATESECWIAAIQAPKLVLAGDHHQLPPTLLSPQNKIIKRSARVSAIMDDEVFTKSMFERVHDKFGNKVCQMLAMQYRMHAKIMHVSSKYLYNNNLVAHPSVSQHLLQDLPDVGCTKVTECALMFIDTCRKKPEEEDTMPQKYANTQDKQPDMPASKLNSGEARLAIKHAQELIKAGVSGKDIAIISPYSGQVRLLKMMSKKIPGVEIGTVDGFQGGEREAVILSLVRSNPKKNVGFLDDYRRMNVAITRARRHLCVIGDSFTISGGGKFLRQLLENLETKGIVCKL